MRVTMGTQNTQAGPKPGAAMAMATSILLKVTNALSWKWPLRSDCYSCWNHAFRFFLSYIKIFPSYWGFFPLKSIKVSLGKWLSG